MRVLRQTIVILSLMPIMLAPVAVAQVGRESTLWSWTIAAPHHDAIVSVSLDGGLGTGIIIDVNRDKPIRDGYEGYCLTANHVVEDDKDRRAIKVIYRNGRSSSKCMVVKSDPKLDVAIVWVWVPSSIAPARIASAAARYGDRVEFAGLGGGTGLLCCLRSFTALASAPTDGDTIYADVPLLPGDSGGPVFNDQHEVVGVISGGWFWWDGGIVTDAGTPIHTTWPARAANRRAIQKVLEGVPQIASR